MPSTEEQDDTLPQPIGELSLQTLAMPKDANANGDIFGGWLVSQMDLASAMLAGRIARGRIATVAIDNIVFIAPVSIGDTVSCYTQLLKIGRSSIKLHVDVWTCEPTSAKQTKVSEGRFTFVAIDEHNRTRSVPPQTDTTPTTTPSSST